MKLTTEKEIEALGLPPEYEAEAKRQLAESRPVEQKPVVQIPAGGDLTTLSDDELWAGVAHWQSELAKHEKMADTLKKETTADKWHIGQYLIELKKRAKHGNFKQEHKKRKITSQRASEDMRIAKKYPTAEEAGKRTFKGALRELRTDGTPEDDNFLTPSWLFRMLDNQYNFTLDAAAHAPDPDEDYEGNAKCSVYITAKEDALTQDWKTWSKGGAVFVNPPFVKWALDRFVKKAHAEAQKGIVVAMILPIWQSCEWFKTHALRYGEIRFLGKKPIFVGSGVREGAACFGSTEVCVCIFRQGQEGKNAMPIVPAGSEGKTEEELLADPLPLPLITAEDMGFAVAAR